MSPRRIAQVSDLHLLSFADDGVTPRADARARFVSLGRAIDPRARVDRALSALRSARELGAQHFVLSGDLTELGLPAELEVLAEVLAAAQLTADEVTMVPGNHDRYSGADAWHNALAGPLAPWARNTPARSSVVDLGSIRLLPLDVTRPQSVMRSAGFIESEALVSLARILGDPAIAAKPAALVQHHPPFSLPPVIHFVDGLRGCERLTAVVERHEAVQVLFGHLHRSIDRGGPAGVPRLLGAPSVAEDARAFRLYDVTSDGLLPVALPPDEAVRCAA